MALAWEYAAELAVASCAAGGALALVERPRARAFGSFLREVAMILALYALWQLAAELSVTGTAGAFGRAEWIRTFEADLHLPSEAGLQQLVLGHPVLVQAANIYYAGVHFPLTFLFLFWIFVRHRDRFRPVRSVLAVTTLCCLLVQLMPVAPPRMMPGIVDTGLLYGQSVYGSGIGADELSAMPSVHMAWAVVVGYYTWRIARGRWRILGPVHTMLTLIVVVVTGNHWLLDCLAAAVIVVISAWVVTGVRTAWRRWRGTAIPGDREERPADAPAGAVAADASALTDLPPTSISADP